MVKIFVFDLKFDAFNNLKCTPSYFFFFFPKKNELLCKIKSP